MEEQNIAELLLSDDERNNEVGITFLQTGQYDLLAVKEYYRKKCVPLDHDNIRSYVRYLRDFYRENSKLIPKDFPDFPWCMSFHIATKGTKIFSWQDNYLFHCQFRNEKQFSISPEHYSFRCLWHKHDLKYRSMKFFVNTFRRLSEDELVERFTKYVSYFCEILSEKISSRILKIKPCA